MYFQAPYTPDSIKIQYRALSKRLHPDKGGSEKDFQEMQKEYEIVRRIIGDLPERRSPKKKILKKAKVKRRPGIYIHIDSEALLKKVLNRLMR